MEKKNILDVKADYPKALESEYVFPVDTDWEINREHLKLGKTLGEGEFGRVMQAEYVKPPATPRIVAVKMLKGETNKNKKQKNKRVLNKLDYRAIGSLTDLTNIKVMMRDDV